MENEDIEIKLCSIAKALECNFHRESPILVIILKARRGPVGDSVDTFRNGGKFSVSEKVNYLIILFYLKKSLQHYGP